MKILYGVQGTGNGHLSRARAMCEQFKRLGVNVDYIFSGRPRDQYFDMEVFGDWQSLSGLTFTVEKGKVKPIATLTNSHPIQLIKDIKSIPVEDYDFVITDFEPVVAWAAHKKKVQCLGIGHQYAFQYPIPKKDNNPVTQTIMNKFAPTTHSIGLHWYHFQQPILPPIVDVLEEEILVEKDKIIVYLPFEDPDLVRKWLEKLTDYQFLYYGAFVAKKTVGNIHFNPVSRIGFQRDLARSAGVISNAGFELASESLSLGKKILAKPLHGQMEQASNALALSQLELGVATQKLSEGVIRDWLDNFEAKKINYPDVAKHIAQWIMAGDLSSQDSLIENLWAQTYSSGLKNFESYKK
ncbi:MAG: glycosyltransferase [Cellvibrionaceae bacterium]